MALSDGNREISLRKTTMRQLEPVRKDLYPQDSELPALAIRPISVTAPPSPGQKRDTSGILEYWLMIRRHQVAVAVAAVLGALAGFYTTLSAPRMYQAHATLEIQALNDNFLNIKELNPTHAGNSS